MTLGEYLVHNPFHHCLLFVRVGSILNNSLLMCKQSFNVNNVDNNKLNINSVNVQTRIYMNSVKLRCRMLLVLILIISVKTNLQYSIHH